MNHIDSKIRPESRYQRKLRLRSEGRLEQFEFKEKKRQIPEPVVSTPRAQPVIPVERPALNLRKKKTGKIVRVNTDKHHAFVETEDKMRFFLSFFKLSPQIPIEGAVIEFLATWQTEKKFPMITTVIAYGLPPETAAT